MIVADFTNAGNKTSKRFLASLVETWRMFRPETDQTPNPNSKTWSLLQTDSTIYGMLCMHTQAYCIGQGTSRHHTVCFRWNGAILYREWFPAILNMCCWCCNARMLSITWRENISFWSHCAVGGLMAYIKKGSVKSLGSGVSTSLLLALCARAMTSPGATGPARVAFGESTSLLSIVKGVVEHSQGSCKIITTHIQSWGLLPEPCIHHVQHHNHLGTAVRYSLVTVFLSDLCGGCRVVHELHTVGMVTMYLKAKGIIDVPHLGCGNDANF